MRRTLRLGAADAQTVLIGPGLLGRLRREAPGVELRFEPLGPDVHGRVESGALDFVFAVATTPLPPGAVSEPIARDRLALVMRRAHPAAERRWTLSDYAEFAHVTVALLGDNQSEIDARLAEAGVARRIASTSPHFMATLACVGATDSVTTISAALARRFAETFGLVLAEPPLVDPSLTLTLVGSALRGHDPALGWLRAHIREAAREAYEPGIAVVEAAVGPGDSSPALAGRGRLRGLSE
jgi:DNA-binding transcriptional LysR family regulator